MKISARTGERLVRMAFEVEQLANRLREDGFEREAHGLSAAMDALRFAGDRVLEKRSDKRAA